MPSSLAAEILGALATGLRNKGFHDAGPRAERNFEIGSFDRLDIAGPFDVEVRTGEEHGVEAEGPQEALQSLSVTTEDNVLVISCADRDADEISIVVTMAQLRDASLAGSGDVSIDRVKGEAFECANCGSGDLKLDEIDVETLALSMTGSGDVQIDKIRAN